MANSPFGIWCLTSIILATFTAVFGFLQGQHSERKQCREKRAALAQEISIRATDFGVKCKGSKSYGELCWHWDEFQGPQNHLAQFSAATMDELTFQYGLLPGEQDKVVFRSLDDAGTAIFKMLEAWSGSAGPAELEAFKKNVKEIICSQIVAKLRQDVETNGERPLPVSPEPSPESSPCQLD